ncbi:MAG: flavin reductase family protein [Dehalococcoidales bacterium]|nr:flavin reductase family protein [Dehalococcoidales bacterium]
MMKKTKLDIMPLLFPHPTIIIGVDVAGKPDFTTVAWVTIACGTPPHMAIALNQVRHSLKGIRENMAFSVNIPNTMLVKETDYCGIATGAKHDKAKDCKFKVFYGEINGTPYIEQCPLNIGCTAEHILKLGSHYLIAGPIKEIYASEDCMTDGKLDAGKIDPIIYMTYPGGTYNKLGKVIGKAFSIGKEIRDIKDDWERQLAK